MKKQIPIPELVAIVLTKLEALNYSDYSLGRYKALYRKIIAYADEKNEKYYTEALGSDFLKEKYDCNINFYTEAMSERLRNTIRALRILGDYQLHGVIRRRMAQKPKYAKPPQFEQVLVNYEMECQQRDYSRRGLRTRMNRLFFLLIILTQKEYRM